MPWSAPINVLFIIRYEKEGSGHVIAALQMFFISDSESFFLAK